jgi:hypothetical protein
VRVSNGRDVVSTDETGAWKLRTRPGDVLFVTKPSGWMTPVDANGLPRFYYIHQPDGSPAGLRYPGIAPTGPLPESIDFALRRRDEPARFEAILIADPQPQTEVELDWIRDDVVAELIGTEALFGMTLGDILFDDLALFPRSNAVMGRIGIPWYNVPGNHELNLQAPDDATSLETFKRNFGPPYYSFEVADAVFYVLDDIEYKGGGESDPADFRGNGGYEARFSRDQLRWLERDLALVPPDKLIMLTMHAPLRTYLGDDRPQSSARNRKDLFALLAGRKHLYAVAGHTHTTEHHYFGKEDGFAGPGRFHHHVLATVSGSWWSGPFDESGIAFAGQRDGTPNGYHVLEVDGVEVRLRYKAAGRPDDVQLRVMIDSAEHLYSRDSMRDFRHGELLDTRLSVDAVPAARVIVDVFDGGPETTVAFSVAERPAVSMQRQSMIDPWQNELFLRNPEVTKSWVSAVPSSHVWVGDLPDDLAAGTYTLSVRVQDEFGCVYHAHRVLEIEGSSAPAAPPEAL